MAQRVVPIRCIRAGYRHLPLRTPANVPMDQGTVFLYSHFEQEEHVNLHDEDSIVNCNIDQQLHPQTLNISSVRFCRISIKFLLQTYDSHFKNKIIHLRQERQRRFPFSNDRFSYCEYRAYIMTIHRLLYTLNHLVQ